MHDVWENVMTDTFKLKILSGCQILEFCFVLISSGLSCCHFCATHSADSLPDTNVCSLLSPVCIEGDSFSYRCSFLLMLRFDRGLRI